MSRGSGSWFVAFALVVAGAVTVAAGEELTAVERGKYLVETVGCAHCHTPVPPIVNEVPEPVPPPAAE